MLKLHQSILQIQYQGELFSGFSFTTNGLMFSNISLPCPDTLFKTIWPNGSAEHRQEIYTATDAIYIIFCNRQSHCIHSAPCHWIGKVVGQTYTAKGPEAMFNSPLFLLKVLSCKQASNTFFYILHCCIFCQNCFTCAALCLKRRTVNENPTQCSSMPCSPVVD